MTKIAHISRHLDSLIAGIIGGATTPVAFRGAEVAARKLTSGDFNLVNTSNFLLIPKTLTGARHVHSNPCKKVHSHHKCCRCGRAHDRRKWRKWRITDRPYVVFAWRKV